MKIQDFKKFTDRFGEIERFDLKLMTKNQKMSTYNRLDLKTLGSRPIMPNNLPRHWFSTDSYRMQKIGVLGV